MTTPNPRAAVTAVQKVPRRTPVGFVQWRGDGGEANVLALLGTGWVGYRRLDGSTFLAVEQGTGGPTSVELSYKTPGAWVGLNPSPSGRTDRVLVLPDVAGQPEGYETAVGG